MDYVFEVYSGRMGMVGFQLKMSARASGRCCYFHMEFKSQIVSEFTFVPVPFE